MKHLDVAAIKNGSVIDHLDSKSTLKVAEILNIQRGAGCPCGYEFNK